MNNLPTLFELDFGSHTVNGKKKHNNEDYYASFITNNKDELIKSGCLFIVADGVGGAAQGEVASKYAAELVKYEYYRQPNIPVAERLRAAFQKANRDIYGHVENNEHLNRMATTMVAAVIIQNTLYIANVGDSRAYLIRDGNAKQLTRDHSIVEEMVRNGAMTEEEARVSSMRNRLSRSIGGEPEVAVDVFQPIPLQLGDKVLLCSDGLTRYARKDDLELMLAENVPEDAAKMMTQFANKAGGADNTTVTVIEVVEKARKRKSALTPQGSKPVLEEWQQALTEYPQKPQREKASIFLYTALIFAVLTTLAVLISNPSKENPVKPNPEIPSIQPSEETGANAVGIIDSIPNINIAPLPSQEGQNSEAEMPDGDSNYKATPKSEAAQSAAPTLDPTSDEPQREEQDWECVYEVQKNDNLQPTLRAFDQTVLGDDKHSYYETCEMDISNQNTYKSCDKKTSILNINQINEGSYLIVFESIQTDNKIDEAKCLNEGGEGLKGKIYYVP